MMMTKKIDKVIVYYEDGTYEEVKASFNDSPYKPYTPNVNPSPVSPSWVPQYTRDTHWPMPVTCTSDGGTYKFTSTGNFAPDNKYTITSTGNGNVDLSR